MSETRLQQSPSASTALPSGALLDDIARDALVDTASLRQHGLGSRQTQAWVRRGLLVWVARGFYSTRVLDNSLDRHLLTTLAALRASPRTSAAGVSGLVVRGIPTFGGPRRVHLVTPGKPSGRRGGHIALRREVAASEWVVRPPAITHPVRCQTVALCVVDAGCELGSEAALVAADYCLHESLASIEEMQAAARPGLLGIAAVRFAKYQTHEALIAEKRREDEIRAQGYMIVRLMWRDLDSLDSGALSRGAGPQE